MNAALRMGRFKVEMFKDLTGKSVDDLWKDYTTELKEKKGDK